jgi:hypothetical protein
MLKRNYIWNVARMREKRNVYTLLVGKSEGKRPLGRRSWIDNIKMDLLEIRLSGLNWSGSGQVQVESSCDLGYEPSGSIKCWELPSGSTTCGLLSGTQLHRVS